MTTYTLTRYEYCKHVLGDSNQLNLFRPNKKHWLQQFTSSQIKNFLFRFLSRIDFFFKLSIELLEIHVLLSVVPNLKGSSFLRSMVNIRHKDLARGTKTLSMIKVSQKRGLTKIQINIMFYLRWGQWVDRKIPKLFIWVEYKNPIFDEWSHRDWPCYLASIRVGEPVGGQSCGWHDAGDWQGWWVGSNVQHLLAEYQNCCRMVVQELCIY